MIDTESRESGSEPFGFLLGHTLRLHQQRSHELMGDVGLHPRQAPIMFTLWRQDGQAQKDLAARLHLSPATITVTVTRLERAGLVERHRDPQDQRLSKVCLTDRGRSLRDTVVRAVRTTNSEGLRGFTAEEKAQLHSLLSRVMTNLREVLDTDRPGAEKSCPVTGRTEPRSLEE